MQSAIKVLIFCSLATIFVSTCCLPNIAATSDGDSENTTCYRLPDNIIPNEYYIRITPFIRSDNSTFDGIIKINATVKKSSYKIVLHADDITVHNLTVSTLDKERNRLTKIQIESITKIEKYQFLNIVLKLALTANTNITIDISYTGKLNNQTYGVFRDWIKVDNNYKSVVGTFFEPTGARKAFPCFDEPGLKATFQIVLVVPKKYTALSNMPVKTVINTDKNNSVFEFETSPLMSTFTVAFVAVEYAHLDESLPSDQTQPRLQRVWSNPELAYQLPHSLHVIPQMLQFFVNKTTVQYPISKLEIIAFPDFPPMAMENWGLLLFSEIYLLYDEKVTPLSIKRYIRNLVAHEISHQWFGNLVTPDWWGYLWLKESFAAYFEYHAHEDELASWNLESQFVVNEMHQAFSVDASPSTHPMSHKVYSPDEIAGIFDLISYNKGASVIRMFEKLLGETIFFDALRRYLLANKYSTGTPELLYSAFEDAVINSDKKVNISMSLFMDSWTSQSGYPVVHVSFDGDTANLRQNQFFLQPSKNVTSESTWIVPITWTSRSEANFNETGNVIWLTDESARIAIPNATNDWVIMNVQQSGYYRVNYDGHMWKRIIDLLKSDDYEVIHELNRAALIDDLFNLGRTGDVDYNTILSASQYLTKETNYIPWRTAFNDLANLKKHFIGQPEIYAYFKVYVMSLLEPHYKRLGFNEKSQDKDFDILFREILLKWLCELDHKECVGYSLELFQKLRQNNSFAISPNLQTAVYCTATRHGSSDDWNYLWNKLQETNFAVEQSTILSALVCTKNTTQLERLLRAVITPEDKIRKQNRKYIITMIADASLLGTNEVLAFLDANHDDIMKTFNGKNVIEDVMIHLSDSIYAEQQLVEKYAGLIGKRMKNSNNIAHSLKSIRYELNWNKQHIPIILDWLKINYPPSKDTDE